MYQLTVKVNHAKGLRSADLNGSSDPICFLNIQGREPHQKTKCISKNLNPNWSEIFNFSGVSGNDTLSIRVCDRDVSFLGKESFTPMGERIISLSEIENFVVSSSHDSSFQLTGATATGEINLSFDLNPKPNINTTATAKLNNLPPSIPIGSTNTMASVSRAGDGLSSPTITISRFVAPTPVFMSFSAGSASLKSGYSMNIFYPDQRPDCNGSSPSIVAGSFLRITITLRVFDEYLDVRFLSFLLSGTKRTWTYLGIDATHKTFIIRDPRAIITFNPESDCTRLQRGVHTFPLQVWIPEACPSSITRAPVETPYLKVHYKIVYSLDVVVGEDQFIKHQLTVCNPSDMVAETEDILRGIPVSVKVTPTGAFGPVCLTAVTNKQSYAQWEDILITVNVNNGCKKKIKYIEAQLVMIPLEQQTSVMRVLSLPGQVVHSWRRLLFPYCYPKNEVQNTIAFPLSDIRTQLPQSFHDGSCSISYELRVIADIPLARDAMVRVPVRLLVTSPRRSLRVVDPISLIPIGDPRTWGTRQTAYWVRHKLQLPGLADEFLRLGVNGSDLVMVNIESFQQLVQAIPDSEPISVENKQALLHGIAALYRQETLPIRLLNALQLKNHVDLFEKQDILGDDLYSLTELNLAQIGVPLGPRQRILAAVRTLQQTGAAGEYELLWTGKMPQV